MLTFEKSENPEIKIEVREQLMDKVTNPSEKSQKYADNLAQMLAILEVKEIDVTSFHLEVYKNGDIEFSASTGSNRGFVSIASGNDGVVLEIATNETQKQNGQQSSYTRLEFNGQNKPTKLTHEQNFCRGGFSFSESGVVDIEITRVKYFIKREGEGRGIDQFAKDFSERDAFEQNFSNLIGTRVREILS